MACLDSQSSILSLRKFKECLTAQSQTLSLGAQSQAQNFSVPSIRVGAAQIKDGIKRLSFLGRCKCEESWQVVMRISAASVVSKISIRISIFYAALNHKYLAEPSRSFFI